MTDPAAAFTTAIERLNMSGDPPPCQVAANRGDLAWISGDAADRRRAAGTCVEACHVLDVCRAAAYAEAATGTIRGGLDFDDPATRNREQTR